jgi:hypothetical protein
MARTEKLCTASRDEVAPGAECLSRTAVLSGARFRLQTRQATVFTASFRQQTGPSWRRARRRNHTEPNPDINGLQSRCNSAAAAAAAAAAVRFALVS